MATKPRASDDTGVRAAADAEGAVPSAGGEAHSVDAHGPGQPSGTAVAHGQHGYSGQRDAYLARLRRIEGQVRGLQRMVTEDQYCIDILTQVSAVTRALQSVALGLLEDHLGHCVADAAATGGPVADDKLREASAAIARLVRS